MANGTAVAVECLKRTGIHEWQPGQAMLVEVGGAHPSPRTATADMHARTHALTHARAHARTHARTRREAHNNPHTTCNPGPTDLPSAHQAEACFCGSALRGAKRRLPDAGR